MRVVILCAVCCDAVSDASSPMGECSPSPFTCGSSALPECVPFVRGSVPLTSEPVSPLVPVGRSVPLGCAASSMSTSWPPSTVSRISTSCCGSCSSSRRPFERLEREGRNGVSLMAANAAGAKVESPCSFTNRFFARALVTCSFRERAPASFARSVRCLEVKATLRAGWFGRSAAEVNGARRPARW